MTTWLTVAQAAVYVRRHENTVRRWIASGDLPATRTGRKIEIDRRDLDALRQPVANGHGEDTTTTTMEARPA